MKIKIEKSVKIPVLKNYHKYPFREMKVGDSFLVPPDMETSALRQAASHYARRSKTDMKISVLKTPEGYRCWRVK